MLRVHTLLADPDMLHDCFGRERHATHKDDMGGVGNFMDDSRTLYIGGLKQTSYESPQALEEVRSFDSPPIFRLRLADVD